MPSDRTVADGIERLCAPLGQVWTRHMFGGFGVYCDRAMFGLIAFDTLYLKTDEVNRGDFEDAGLDPFVYETAARSVRTSYHRAPEAGLDDWRVLEPLARGALAAAERALAARRPRRSHRSS